jgi:cutinase
MGPLVCNGLKKLYGDKQILCQGVGAPYTASIADNVSAKGTSVAAIREATRMFTMADQKCPKSVITFGGYRYAAPKLAGARINR